MKMALSVNDKQAVEIDLHKNPLDFAGEHMADDYLFAIKINKQTRWMVFRKRANWNRVKVRRFLEITRDRHTRILFTRPSWYLVIYP